MNRFYCITVLSAGTTQPRPPTHRDQQTTHSRKYPTRPNQHNLRWLHRTKLSFSLIQVGVESIIIYTITIRKNRTYYQTL